MKEKIFMVLFLLILGCGWTLALVGVDRFTRPYIEEHRAKTLKATVLDVLEIPYEEATLNTVFEQNVELVKVGEPERTVYRAKNGVTAFAISGVGCQGPISGVVAMEADLKTIKAIAISENVETPGLGDRVLARENLARFKGKAVVPQLVVTRQGKAVKENEVDGVTGATLTSKAFEKLLNSELSAYLSLLRGEGK